MLPAYPFAFPFHSAAFLAVVAAAAAAFVVVAYVVAAFAVAAFVVVVVAVAAGVDAVGGSWSSYFVPYQPSPTPPLQLVPGPSAAAAAAAAVVSAVGRSAASGECFAAFLECNSFSAAVGSVARATPCPVSSASFQVGHFCPLVAAVWNGFEVVVVVVAAFPQPSLGSLMRAWWDLC